MGYKTRGRLLCLVDCFVRLLCRTVAVARLVVWKVGSELGGCWLTGRRNIRANGQECRV